MVIVKPFKGIRANSVLAHKIASLPYDIVNRYEIKNFVKENEYSPLRDIRSMMELDEDIEEYEECEDIEVIEEYENIIYEKISKNLKNMIIDRTMSKDEKSSYYIYRQIKNGGNQTGIIGCVSIDDYLDNSIKKHEHIILEKEVKIRKRFDHFNINTEPILLIYKKNQHISDIICKWTQEKLPVYNFSTEDNTTHILWVIDDPMQINSLEALFKEVQNLYIADGHHRTASVVKIGQNRRSQSLHYTGEESFNYFMAVIFPDDELTIMEYNRVVKELGNLTVEDFLKEVSKSFYLSEWQDGGPYKPEKKHNFGMYIENKWYKLTVREKFLNNKSQIDCLDANILQKHLLDPILGIENPRIDSRIDFVGGIRGLKELERRVNTDMRVGFSMYPTTMEELFLVAGMNEIMPPKSTWFEPKLRSGLFVFSLE